MTHILSTRILKQLRSTTLTAPKKVAPPPRHTRLADDSFMHGPKKVSPQKLADDSFMDASTKPTPTPIDDGFVDSPKRQTSSPGDRVIELATSVVGENAHDLKLANDTELGAAMQDWVGDTVNCANFVSGLLTATGQIPKSEGHAAVTGLVANLRADQNFTEVSLEDASPGDVVAFEYSKKDGSKGHHVVVFEGRDENGTPKFIGSNNVNKNGTQRISHSTGYSSRWDVLAVMHYTGE